jgi:hypothetical protein
MLLGVLQLIVSGHVGAMAVDTGSRRAPVLDTVPVVAPVFVPRIAPVDSIPDLAFTATAPGDTTRRRRKAVHISEWYYRRLTIHRYVAYSTIPVFALQYAAGDRLYHHGNAAPTWAKTMHRVGATTLATMFTVNTVTGAWNWWDSRSVSEGRVLRTVHALSMIGADAAFTYAGIKLSDEAENSSAKRREHRTVAIASIGVTVVSGLAMKLWNH